MRKIFSLLFILLPFITQAQTPKVSAGTIVHIQNFESKYVPAHNVDIWLPDGYSTTKKYAVLYLQDGQELFDSSMTENKIEWRVDETLAKLTNEGRINDCIVVATWNRGRYRHNEYLPQKSFSSFPAAAQDSMYKVEYPPKKIMLSDKVSSDNYLRFMVKELKPYIDANYSTKKNRKNTLIAGASMGGLISLYAICEYPHIFGGAACISTWWSQLYIAKNNTLANAFNQYLQKNLPSPKNHKIYFDYGTKDIDAYVKPMQPFVDSILLSKGYGTKNFMSKEFRGAGHNIKSWRERLESPFVFLLGKD